MEEYKSVVQTADHVSFGLSDPRKLGSACCFDYA